LPYRPGKSGCSHIVSSDIGRRKRRDRTLSRLRGCDALRYDLRFRCGAKKEKVSYKNKDDACNKYDDESSHAPMIIRMGIRGQGIWLQFYMAGHFKNWSECGMVGNSNGMCHITLNEEIMPRKKSHEKVEVETYDHKGAKRKNIPLVGLVSSVTDPIDHKKKYQHDPHIDPYLSWAGKKEGTEFEVQNVSLHIHERIDPQRIIKSFLKKDTGPKQVSLFEQPDNEPPLNKAIDFYKHEQDWTNRLIAGDSLLVMNSLLNKEGIAGKVQMIYMDPPYGIKYNSNFQPFVDKKDVKDRDEDIPAEPEMIQAFRDMWELDIHSYLTHLRDRLLLAKELLHESGSVFVQISDENVHHVRELLDEIFEPENFMSLITFRKKTRPLRASYLESMSDYIVWYARNKEKGVKFHKLFIDQIIEGDKSWKWVELPDGVRRIMSEEEINNHELLPKNSRIFQIVSMIAAGFTPSCVFEIEFKGNKYSPKNGSWVTNKEGINNLIKQNRIVNAGKTLGLILYHEDYPVTELNNLWARTVGPKDKIYVVQTNTTIVEKCLLMCTDPGDLVFDPTCGSGTTAFVAEQWGRRWITCDTSRVAITLAKQRLMTANFDYYELAHKAEGIRSGLKYRTVPHLTVKSIAQEGAEKEETLYDQPIIEKNKVRVTGPFTVEAVPSLRIKPFDGKEPKIEGNGRELSQTGETGNQTLYRDELKTTGIRTTGGKKIEFSMVEPMVDYRRNV